MRTVRKGRQGPCLNKDGAGLLGVDHHQDEDGGTRAGLGQRIDAGSARFRQCIHGVPRMSNPRTSYPALTRFSAMGAPMDPRPTKAMVMFCFMLHLNRR